MVSRTDSSHVMNEGMTPAGLHVPTLYDLLSASRSSEALQRIPPVLSARLRILFRPAVLSCPPRFRPVLFMTSLTPP